MSLRRSREEAIDAAVVAEARQPRRTSLRPPASEHRSGLHRAGAGADRDGDAAASAASRRADDLVGAGHGALPRPADRGARRQGWTWRWPDGRDVTVARRAVAQARARVGAEPMGWLFERCSRSGDTRRPARTAGVGSPCTGRMAPPRARRTRPRTAPISAVSAPRAARALD